MQFGFPNLESPASGNTLINDSLEPAFEALYSQHMGNSRPSYASDGLIWTDNTTNPRILKYFNGTVDIVIGTLNNTTNIFTPNMDGLGSLATQSGTFSGSHSGTSSGTNTGDQAIGTGTDADTGTDNAKIMTAKALKDSHNIPSVAPSTSGNVMTSNGTNWISAALTSPFVKFKSSLRSITIGTPDAVAHGLGAEPDMVILKLQATANDGQYVTGDRLFIVPEINLQAGAAGNTGLSCRVDGTNITIRFSSDGYRVIDKTSGTIANGGSALSLNAKWNIEIFGIKFN
jgi:hypothetical protein